MSNNSKTLEQQRTELKITRLNHSFLLKDMSYHQHYSHVYVARHASLKTRIIELAKSKNPDLQPARILEVSSDEQKIAKEQQKKGMVPDANGRPSANTMMIGKRRLLIGTLFKNMPLFRPFLKEYTAELVRLEAGDDGDDEDGEEGGGGADDAVGGDDGVGDEGLGGMIETQEITGENRNALQQDGAAKILEDASSSAYYQEWPRINSERDILILEDDSGRIELSGANVNPDLYTTGVIVGVAGAVNERGLFVVEQFFTAEAAPPLQPSSSMLSLMSSSSNKPPEPTYIAFVSGLNITGLGAAPASIELLVDFLSGNLGDDTTIQLASRIARVFIGGGLITDTEESKLTQKVKLEPTDHARLSEVATGKTAQHTASCAGAMRHADRLVSLLAKTVPVELMPGPSDATNCFLPQQPIHPLLLNQGSKTNSLRLVTNPCQFEAHLTQESGASSQTTKTSFLISSGQNASDIVRQTSLSGVQAMRSLLKWGHLCPTAPNTLPCFPFRENDPFVIRESPNCFISCNQEKYETMFEDGVRFVSVPKYVYSDQIVLVNVASPKLDTRVITLTLSEE